jgi:imidazolonepropionase-like amidohydrolase
MVDGTGSAPREAALHIQAERIAGIGEAASFDAAPDAETHDLNGWTVLPGFIDSHVHIMMNPDPSASIPRRNIPARDWDYVNSRRTLFAIGALERTLDAGFTTIRDMSAPNAPIFALRDALANGEIRGPRLLASGMCITHWGGHGMEALDGSAHIADGRDAILAATRKQITAGADVIKIMGGTRPAFSPPFKGRPGYTADEMLVAVVEAHRALTRTAAHAHSDMQGILDCIAAGIDSIEHGWGLNTEGAAQMAANGQFLCPTLSVPPAAIEAMERGLWTYPGAEDQVKRTLELSQQAIQHAVAQGVRVSFGTDASLPLVWHGGNAWEFELMVDYGMTAMQAIIAATHNAALNIGMADEIGTLQTGKLADIVVVDGDPLADIRILRDPRRIKLVIQSGRIVVDRRAAKAEIHTTTT